MRKVATSWSRRSAFSRFTRLLFQPVSETHWTLRPDRGQAEELLATRFDELAARFSPSGEWLAYVSAASEERQVYVQPYPGPGRPIPISSDGGEGPVWSPDGTELFFFRRKNPGIGELFAVPVKTKPTFEAGTPRRLFEGPSSLKGMETRITTCSKTASAS
jgi:Tol biopolymer transport system component